MISQASTNPARGPIRAKREVNRRKMKAARPPTTPAVAFRIRQWYAAIEQARDDKKISLGCDRYLRRIKGQVTVAMGGYADVRDAVMGGWLGRSRRTVMRYRAEAVRAGLLEDEGTAGRDHKPCMVRPILPDGPVFTDISVTHSVTKPAHQPTQFQPTERPPKSPIEQDNAPKQSGQALVAPDLVSKEPTPAKPPERIGQGLGDDAVAPPEPITFSQFWAATDKGGAESAAAAAWDRLSGADKAAIAAAIRREGRLQTGTSWVANWLKYRRWPTLDVPQTKQQVGVRVEADSAAGVAWRRYWRERRQRGLATGRDGYFVPNPPTLWPPEK